MKTIITSILFLIISSTASAASSFDFQFKPTDSYIGNPGGSNLPYHISTSDEFEVIGSINRYELFGVYTETVGFSIFGPNDNWTLFFGAPDGEELKVGLYENSIRGPYKTPSNPLMDIGGNGRGENSLYGYFNILELNYEPDGAINRFAVTFRQYESSADLFDPTRYITGSFQYNVNGSVSPIPEPTSYAMLLAGIALISVVARRKG